MNSRAGGIEPVRGCQVPERRLFPNEFTKMVWLWACVGQAQLEGIRAVISLCLLDGSYVVVGASEVLVLRKLPSKRQRIMPGASKNEPMAAAGFTTIWAE